MPLTLIKLGGSLITHKGKKYELDLERLTSYAELLGEHLNYVAGTVVFVLGGGSFGNRIILDVGLHGDGSKIARTDRSLMTEVMLKYQLEICSLLRRYNVPTFPIQSGVFVGCKSGLVTLCEVVNHLRSDGLIPLLSGDYFLNRDGCWNVLSSDELLIYLSRELRPSKVVVLTDVPGVIDFGQNEAIIAEVLVDSADYALSQAGSSKNPDATGGMRKKLECLIAIAHLGIRSFILDGRNVEGLRSALFDERPYGTMICPAP